MSENTSHCPFCGSLVEAGSEFCPNCGATLSDTPNFATKTTPTYPADSGTYGSAPSQQYGGTYTKQPGTTYQTTTTYVRPQSSSSSSNGTLALILSILSCVGILPCIGSIIAIIIGSAAAKEGDSNGRIAVILGWVFIGLVVGVVVIYLIIFALSGILFF